MSETIAVWPVPELVPPSVDPFDDPLAWLAGVLAPPDSSREADRTWVRRPLTIRERESDGDREAAVRLGAVFETHYRELYAFVHRYVHSRALAEEIIQDAFLAVWQRRRTWGEHMDVKAYVFQTARNRALNFLRRERVELDWQRLVAARRDAWGMSQYTSDSRLVADVDEMIEHMQRAVGALPRRVRRTIILRLQWHLTNAEIGEVMGISAKAVERNVTRGLKALREALGGKG